MAIQDWAITVLDLSWVVKNNNLSNEEFNFSSWVILSIRADVSSSNIFNRDVFNIETNVITGDGLFQSFVMHFYGFNIGSNVNWCECNVHVWFKNTSFNSSDWNRSNTTNFVDIL